MYAANMCFIRTFLCRVKMPLWIFKWTLKVHWGRNASVAGSLTYLQQTVYTRSIYSGAFDVYWWVTVHHEVFIFFFFLCVCVCVCVCVLLLVDRVRGLGSGFKAVTVCSYIEASSGYWLKISKISVRFVNYMRCISSCFLQLCFSICGWISCCIISHRTQYKTNDINDNI